MAYFKECRTIEDVKRAFKEYAKQLHPDCGGDPEEFKAMMQEYHKVFEMLKNVHVNAAGETYEQESTETPEQFAAIIETLIHLQGIVIEIIGSWVWVSGATFPYREQLKEVGFTWSKSKKSWYHTGDPEHSTRRRGRYSMTQLRDKWGTQEVQTQEQQLLA